MAATAAAAVVEAAAVVLGGRGVVGVRIEWVVGFEQREKLSAIGAKGASGRK